MQNLAKKTFIAIEAVLYVALHSGATPVRGKHICESQGVASRYLEQIMQKLVRDGILKSIRGPRGGYVLAMDRRKILLRDIYDSMNTLETEEPSHELRSPLREQVIEPFKAELKTQIRGFLKQKTIQDLCDQAMEADVADLSSASDFSI